MKDRDEQASDWFARMRGPDADQYRAAFEAWRRDPANAAAYADAEDDWLAIGGLPPQDRIGSPRAPTAARRPFGGWAAAAALVLALALGGAWYLRANPDQPKVGEQGAIDTKTVSGKMRLVDGSEVILMDGAKVETHFDAKRRDVIFLSGRARFIVAHDAARPFVVWARGSQTMALGTIFEVDLRQRQPLVHLVEGSVDVRADHGTRSMRLRPGESAEIDGVGPRRVAVEVSAAGTTILQAEQLVLGDLIERANRVGGVPIRLAEPALAVRRVSGRFDISETGALARKLAAALDLNLESDPTGYILSAKGKKAGE